MNKQDLINFCDNHKEYNFTVLSIRMRGTRYFCIIDIEKIAMILKDTTRIFTSIYQQLIKPSIVDIYTNNKMPYICIEDFHSYALLYKTFKFEDRFLSEDLDSILLLFELNSIKKLKTKKEYYTDL